MRLTQLIPRRSVFYPAVIMGCWFFLCAAAPVTKTVLFLGDSITAGYGVDPWQAYPAIIQNKIDAKGWRFKVINAGQSGDTSAGGLSRLEWLLKNRIDILVLELGANDGLRGLPVENTKKNLQAIIDRTRKRYPQVKIIIAGMKLPPNWGGDYSRRFEAMFFELAKKNKTALIPFVLEGVGGMRNLNLSDAIHPTPEGHKLVAANVWKVLEPVMRSLDAARS
jgi:acyl-CoA thioesterase-1